MRMRGARAFVGPVVAPALALTRVRLDTGGLVATSIAATRPPHDAATLALVSRLLLAAARLISVATLAGLGLGAALLAATARAVRLGA